MLRAYDPKLQREVALKEVRGDVLDAESKARLVAEARAMAKLSHPNVGGVYDVESVEFGARVLVMEYVAGQTLRSWLRGSEQGWQAIVQAFIDAGRGLAAAHVVGLLHRDFKPANVLVAPLSSRAERAGGLMDGRTVKVTDFGLAKGVSGTVSSHGGVSEPERELVTEAGWVMGTPRYMAPEQHAGAPLGAAADQYALCVALWEGLCGSPPFTGRGIETQKMDGPPAWPAGSSVPRVIAQAVRRGLSPNATDRWPSVEVLLEALSYNPGRRRGRIAAAVATVGLLGVAGLGWNAWAQARAKRCSGAAEQLDAVWGLPRRASVETAMLGLDVPYATRAWKNTSSALDAYAQDWASMHTQACEATTLRGEQSAAVMDLRMTCLHRATVGFSAVVRVLEDADVKVLEKAHALVGGLRPLSRCADVEALQQDVEPPLPEEADAVEGVRALLEKAGAEANAGRYSQAHERVVEARTQLDTVTYGPVQTEVRLAMGLALQALGRHEEAEAELESALESGAHWRQWYEIGTAAQQLMFVVGYLQARPEEGLEHRTLAWGAAQGDPVAQAPVRNNLAAGLCADGERTRLYTSHRH